MLKKLVQQIVFRSTLTRDVMDVKSAVAEIKRCNEELGKKMRTKRLRDTLKIFNYRLSNRQKC